MLLGGSEMLVVRYGGFQREYVFERENDLGLYAEACAGIWDRFYPNDNPLISV